MIRIDLSSAQLNEDIHAYQDEVTKHHTEFKERKGLGSNFSDWIRWPLDYDKDEFKQILDLKERLRGKYNTVVVCGIGASYLGTAAADSMIRGLYPDDGIEMIYIGNTLSAPYNAQLLKKLQKEDKEIVLVVVSKSGTTTETAIAFRLFETLMYEKYGDKAVERIIAITDRSKGTLKSLADKKGYETFVVPDKVGGRYSVFTPVGLVPLILGNVNIEELMKGSLQAYHDFLTDDIDRNPAYQYAVARRILDKKGYSVELFVTYHLQLQLLAEWIKQLFGESEGKDGKGILPTSACFTTDLHSLGQFIQEGSKVLFETVLKFDRMDLDVEFPFSSGNEDNMNYLSGKKLSWINDMAFEGTLDAHSNDGDNPNIVIHFEDNSAYSFGYLIYFFFRACSMSCYLLNVNPFNQPGVEVYKQRMFKLLGKE